MKTDSFTQPVSDRVATPTVITNVYAVLKGTNPEARSELCWSPATTTPETATLKTPPAPLRAPTMMAAARL